MSRYVERTANVAGCALLFHELYDEVTEGNVVKFAKRLRRKNPKTGGQRIDRNGLAIRCVSFRPT